MGTRMAPSYASLFMGKFEQQFLQVQDKLAIVLWRCINDVFAIWTHRVPCLNAVLWELNNHHMTIKFTADWSTREVMFLGTRVFMKDGKVEMDLHIKPTSKHQCLQTKSCRSKHCKTAILYSQALRIKRICSEQENLSLRTNQLNTISQGEDTLSNCLTLKSIEQLTHPRITVLRTVIDQTQIAYL